MFRNLRATCNLFVQLNKCSCWPHFGFSDHKEDCLQDFKTKPLQACGEKPLVNMRPHFVLCENAAQKKLVEAGQYSPDKQEQ